MEIWLGAIFGAVMGFGTIICWLLYSILDATEAKGEGVV